MTPTPLTDAAEIFTGMYAWHPDKGWDISQCGEITSIDEMRPLVPEWEWKPVVVLPADFARDLEKKLAALTACAEKMAVALDKAAPLVHGDPNDTLFKASTAIKEALAAWTVLTSPTPK